MAGTIICDYIRTDANQLSLNVGNLTFATINASGFFSNTGTQLIAANGKVSGASVIASSIPTAAIADSAITRAKMGYTGAILQTVISNPSIGVTSISSSSWTEASSSFRVSITPTSASSTLLLQCLFMFGGNFTSNITHFKLYDITNSADVNLAAANGSRTPAHGAVRQVDSDVNDADLIQLSVSVSAGSTNARTYGLYGKNESGSGAKYYFANASDAAQLTVVRPVFVVYEIAA
jgi:hypothetical protein